MENNYGIRDFSEINAVLARMSALLNAGDFQQADGCCDYVLHLLPGYGPAYLGKLLAEFGLKAPNELLTTDAAYTGSENYRNALYYGDAETQRFLRTAPYENFYLRAKTRMDEAKGTDDLKVAAGMFHQLSGYRDSDALARQCVEKVESGQLEELYQKAQDMMNVASDEAGWLSAADAFACVSGYQDAAEQRNLCLQNAENLRKDRIYSSSADPAKCSDLQQLKEALQSYEKILGWKDSSQRADMCRNRISDLEKAEAGKQKRNFWIVAAVLFVILVTVGMIFGIIPLSKYNRASDLMRNGFYTEAAEMFTGLNGFLDSDNKAQECVMAEREKRYQDAGALMESGNYPEAVELFLSLNGYKDSAGRLEEAQRMTVDGRYETAVQMIRTGSYMQAAAILTELGDYKDSADLLEEAYAGKAVSLSRTDVDSAAAELEAMDPETAAAIIAKMDPAFAAPLLITAAQPGDSIRFGHYEQDNDQVNGAEWIEWIVLAREDGVLTMISRYALDIHSYHEEPMEIDWASCGLRDWLNGEFFENAFSPEEQGRVRLETVQNPDLPEYGISGGPDSEDRVYLLSIPEAEQYFASDQERRAEATVYASELGANTDEEGYATWWLRTAGFDSRNAAYVYCDGAIHYNGIYTTSSQDSVRPVIRIGTEPAADGNAE